MIMKKQLLLLAMILLPMMACAETVEVDGIYYNIVPKGNAAEVIQNPNTYSGDIVIPETFVYENEEFTVTSISANAFKKCTELTSVVIANSINTIGDSAFSGCSELVSVTISERLISIDNYAFEGCKKLMYINIPNSVESIGYMAFSYSGLVSITIGRGMKTIYSGAFEACNNLASVHISDLSSWCQINFNSSYASWVQSYTNPLSQAHHLYLNNEEIVNLVIPDDVTFISDAFDGCTGLESVTFGKNVTFTKTNSFRDCTNLVRVMAPDITTWLNIKFYCNPLSYAHHLYIDNKEITDIIIPNGINTIKYGAFNGASFITSISFPSSLTSIEESAFQNCSSLLLVKIPRNVNFIGDSSFSGCSKLEDFYCYTEKFLSIPSYTFKDSYIEYATLHVPTSLINAYKEATPWKNFGKIISLDGEEIQPSKCTAPTINYQNGKLCLASETEGADIVTEITNDDIGKYYDSEISLTITYTISAYAAKHGYDNSDVVTATLCWIDKEPMMEGITAGVAQIPSKAVLIQSEGGIISLQGVDDGTQVSAYTADGVLVGSVICRNDSALLNTNLRPGTTVIMKIGEKSIKVIIH